VAPVTKIDFTPGSAELDPNHQFVCEFSNQEMRITVDPLDSTQQEYNGFIADEGVPAQPLAGIGDTAVWAGVILSNVVTSAPDVIAHKGSVTCIVESPGTGLTITPDTGPIGGSTVAAAASFAARTGLLCNDIFAAIA
jgi:hypothetical protein